MNELLSLSGTELARRIREREVSSEDVIETHIARIRQVNPALNALVAERFGPARAEARAVDERLRAGLDDEPPAFFGVPCSIKESFALAGMPQTAGLVARRGTVSRSDATAVARLRAAGAIPLGVTNVSELCMWMESDNRVYGRTSNPYDPTRTVGGSSGGEGAILGAGPGILTGALTTAGAFVALAVNEFMAFSQLGVITGVGLLFVLCTTLTAMPAMLLLPSLRFLHGSTKAPPLEHQAAPRIDLPGFIVRHPVALVIGGLAVAALMLLRAQQIPWSYDYLKLMPAGLTSVRAMQTLSDRTEFSAGVSAVVAGSVDEARRMAAKLRAKPTIRRVESLASFLPEDQGRKLALLRRLGRALDAPREAPPREAVELAGIKRALQELADALEDARFEAKRGGAEEAKLLAGPIGALQRLRRTLDRVPAADSTRRLAALQKLLLDGLDQGIALLKQNVHAEPITAAGLLAELPSGLRDRLFSGAGGRGQFAVYAYPAQPIWDKAYLGRLITDLRAVSAESTGFPVTHWESSQGIERGFRHAAIVATIVLVLMLLIDFRSPRFTLLALAPLALGMAFMWGGISLLGLSYNFVNIIAFPLIIGIGVASGVHILHRYRQEGEQDVAPVVRFTGMAIFLSAATTMVGFGSLALAQHRGAASLGLVLLLGVGSCLLTATLFLPAVLELLRRRRARK